MFGTDDMVNTGMGVKELGVFNKMTVIGLYDIKALATVGTENVDTSFVWKLCVLAAIAVVCYTAGAVYFTKKDLPL
jgi:ABC-type transport system involved in multi-copper enzyme maturation permease subunit